MKALVTGGAGFIGSHLVRGLLDHGWQVAVIDDLSTGRESNLPEAAAFHVGDVLDPGVLGGAMDGCDTIFHLAAVSSVQDSLDRPLDVHHANLTGTLALLEAASARGVRRFIFSSSAAVYGDTNGQPAREDMIPRPLSHYAVQKLASEHYCGVYHRLHGLETVCLRYFNIFGPRQRDDSPYSGVIAKFIEAARHGRAPVIFGDGGQTRDFCDVRDVVAANLAAATAPATGVTGESFNIGTGQTVSVRQVAEHIQSLVPGCPPPEHREARSGEVRASCADLTKAGQRLGFRPSVTFGEGLAALLAAR